MVPEILIVWGADANPVGLRHLYGMLNMFELGEGMLAGKEPKLKARKPDAGL